MKLTFEGDTIYHIFIQMEGALAAILKRAERDTETAQAAVLPGMAQQVTKAQGSGLEPFAEVKREVKEVLQKIEQRLPADVAGMVDKPVDKPGKKPRTPKQLENDEKLRAAALERIAARKAATVAGVEEHRKQIVASRAAPVEKAVEKAVEKPVEEPEVSADPAEVVRIRQKTIIDLQEAYANGHQQEVFELLSRFGNGAKSFRELPPEAFMPIRDAIDKGALT